MFARRHEEVISRHRPGMSIKKVMIAIFLTARQFIALDALPKWQKYNQEYVIQNILPPLLHEKLHFSRQKIAINFSGHMDNSIYHNGHRVIDELRRLTILRALHPPYSSDISPCDFWMVGDFKGKLKDCDLQGPKEILTVFEELWDKVTFQKLQMVFESWRHRLQITSHRLRVCQELI
jgi:hypothetical protein